MTNMKICNKIITTSLITVTILLAPGCTKTNAPSSPSATDKATIVTSFYPLYDAVAQITGEKVNLMNITPPGIEPHDYEPTPQDVINLTTADLVIINGLGLEPWESKLTPELKEADIPTLKISDHLAKEQIQSDPHLWLDPTLHGKTVTIIAEELAKLDPQNSQLYQKNAASYREKLLSLDTGFVRSLKNCKHKTFITGHSAFAYLARRYDLTMLPIAGLTPEAEPSPREMAQIAKLVKEKGIHFILTESLTSPKIAQTIATSTKAQTLVLNPIEGLTPEEAQQGQNYLTLMKDNLKSLQKALECETTP